MSGKCNLKSKLRGPTKKEPTATLKIRMSLPEEIISDLGRTNRRFPYRKPSFFNCYVSVKAFLMEFNRM